MPCASCWEELQLDLIVVGWPPWFVFAVSLHRSNVHASKEVKHKVMQGGRAVLGWRGEAPGWQFQVRQEWASDSLEWKKCSWDSELLGSCASTVLVLESNFCISPNAEFSRPGHLVLGA